MGTTSNYAFPYPELSDSPNVPANMASLAQAIDTRIKSTNDAIAALQASASSGWQNTVVYKSGTQSVASAAWTAIQFDVEVIDTGNGWASGTPTQIVMQQTGQFVIWATAGFAANSTGNRGIALRINGATTYISINNTPTSGSEEWYSTVDYEGRFNAGDYLEVVVRQASGSTISTSSSMLPRFSARRVL